MSSLQPPAAIGRDADVARLRLSILHVPECPLVCRLRARVESALEKTGFAAFIEEVEGPYSSPTLLIDGVALPAFPLDAYAACRIDLPTDQEIASAILAAATEDRLLEEGVPNESR